MLEDSDAELIRRTLKGDIAAWAKLMGRYEDRLFNTVFRLLGNAQDAEDVVQETFLNAYQSLHTFKGESQVFTWCYRIAYSTAVRHRREKKGSLRDEEERRIRAAMERLSPDLRQILTLKEIEGQKYPTIAEILGIPIDAVRQRLHQARRELRALLQRAPGAPARPTDAQLVTEALHGNDASFAKLMLRYEGALRSMVNELVADLRERNIIRECIVASAYRSLKQFDGGMPFISWLYAIAKRVVEEEERKHDDPQLPE